MTAGVPLACPPLSCGGFRKTDAFGTRGERDARDPGLSTLLSCRGDRRGRIETEGEAIWDISLTMHAHRARSPLHLPPFEPATDEAPAVAAGPPVAMAGVIRLCPRTHCSDIVRGQGAIR